VGTAGREPLDDHVALRDELVDDAPPVGQRRPEHRRGPAHTLRPVGRPGERRVVVDEARIQIAVNGGEVACAEQLLNEGLDELLVARGLIGGLSGHRPSVRQVRRPDHPRKVGFLRRSRGATLGPWPGG
jgi:hypothetical protein